MVHVPVSTAFPVRIVPACLDLRTRVSVPVVVTTQPDLEQIFPLLHLACGAHLHISELEYPFQGTPPLQVIVRGGRVQDSGTGQPPSGPSLTVPCPVTWGDACCRTLNIEWQPGALEF